MRVLLVEDDSSTAKAIELSLASEGIICDTTELGEADHSQLVLNLRGGDRIRTDAVTAVLELLESRYQLAEIALFHRTKLSATAMLERAVAELTAAYVDPAAYSATLGKNNVNIADMSLARDKETGKALTLLTLDTAPSEAVIAELEKIEGISRIHVVAVQ